MNEVDRLRQTRAMTGNGNRPPAASQFDTDLHPAWRAFLRFCAELRYGEIEGLKIQDGLPVLAEVTRKKVKFTT